MKKIVFAVIALFLILGSAKAQDDKLIRFGIHGNTGLTWMKADQDSLDDQGMRLGFGYGFIGELNIASNFSLVTGFDVSYIGGNIEKSPVEYVYPPDSVLALSTQTSTYKLQYLDVPFTLKMKTNEINYITYFFRIGGSFGVNLKAKADIQYKEQGGSKALTNENVDIKDESSFMRANFVVGGGIEYSLGGSTSALLELSFTNGLTNLIDKTNVIGNYFAVKVGVMF